MAGDPAEIIPLTLLRNSIYLLLNKIFFNYLHDNSCLFRLLRKFNVQSNDDFSEE